MATRYISTYQLKDFQDHFDNLLKCFGEDHKKPITLETISAIIYIMIQYEFAGESISYGDIIGGNKEIKRNEMIQLILKKTSSRIDKVMDNMEVENEEKDK